MDAGCRPNSESGVLDCSLHGFKQQCYWLPDHRQSNWEEVMKTYTMTLLAGVAIGAIALQGLHAQGAKLKAYAVSEAEILDPSAQAPYLPAARKVIAEAHGRPLRTAAGRVVPIEAGPPAKSAAIVEWDSLDDAVAFYKSKALPDL